MFFHKSERRDTAKQSVRVFAAVSGSVFPVTQVEDPVFAKKILGDGVAIHPTDGEILAPVSGKVINIADTCHAYGLQTDGGVELLLHIGINTVDLKGKGFQNLVRLNQKVKAGAPLCSVDMDFLRENHYCTDVIILVTDPRQYQIQNFHTGITAEAGKTCIMELKP